MALVHSVAAPAATTLTTVYTPGAGENAIVNITLQNKGTGAATVRLGIEVSATMTYYFYDYSLAANSAPIGVAGVRLDDTTTVKVYCSTANCECIVNGEDDT
jgi:hypothetical protein